MILLFQTLIFPKKYIMKTLFIHDWLLVSFVQQTKYTSHINQRSEFRTLLFPDLFPNGCGHYWDTSAEFIPNNYNNVETYGKYIKRRIIGIDPRFRLHHTWPAWSYLQLEKLRNHQNRQRLLRQHNATNTTSLPTGPDTLYSIQILNRP